MTLIETLSRIPEFRRAQGTRHALPTVLLCLLLGTLSGCLSWRDHGDFVQRHRKALLQHLGLEKNRLPSYSTLRRVLLHLDFSALSTAFLAWARQRVPIEDGEWLAADGKSLRGTALDPQDPQQNFTALVTLYARKRGLVLQAEAYQNKEQSEVHVVEALLADADLKGASVSLDALHCRKKRATSSARQTGTT